MLEGWDTVSEVDPGNVGYMPAGGALENPLLLGTDCGEWSESCEPALEGGVKAGVASWLECVGDARMFGAKFALCAFGSCSPGGEWL